MLGKIRVFSKVYRFCAKNYFMSWHAIRCLKYFKAMSRIFSEVSSSPFVVLHNFHIYSEKSLIIGYMSYLYLLA